MLDNKTILLTGGTGSLSNALVDYLLANYSTKKIIVYSRDELKQSQQQDRLGYRGYDNEPVRWVIGDVRDLWRTERAFKGVDYVIHTAALKQVPASFYNPIEYIYTNVIGAINVIHAAESRGVKKVIGISTDKAVEPVNLYGKTKACADDLFINANCYGDTIFSLVRYGNVSNSRGSVIPIWREKIKKKEQLGLTDVKMTRFWLTLGDAVKAVIYGLEQARGGEVFIPYMRSYFLADLIQAMTGKRFWEHIGIRIGEKLHEVLWTEYDDVKDAGGYYVIYPPKMWKKYEKAGMKVFGYYSSKDTSLTVEDLKKRLKEI